MEFQNPGCASRTTRCCQSGSTAARADRGASFGCCLGVLLAGQQEQKNKAVSLLRVEKVLLSYSSSFEKVKIKEEETRTLDWEEVASAASMAHRAPSSACKWELKHKPESGPLAPSRQPSQESFDGFVFCHHTSLS